MAFECAAHAVGSCGMPPSSASPGCGEKEIGVRALQYATTGLLERTSRQTITKATKERQTRQQAFSYYSRTTKRLVKDIQERETETEGQREKAPRLHSRKI